MVGRLGMGAASRVGEAWFKVVVVVIDGKAACELRDVGFEAEG